MRRALLGASLLFGCHGAMPSGTSAVPQSAPTPASASAAPTTEDAAPDLAEIRTMFEAAGIDDEFFSDRELKSLTEQGMTTALAAAALGELAQSCTDVRTPTCGQTGQDALLRQGLVRWLEDHGDLSAASVLLRLDHFGDFRSALALEAALTRRMEANLRPCAPPSEAEIAAVRAELSSFVVLEHRRDRLEGRAATADELDDLAYFLAAVADNGPGAGSVTDQGRSGATLTEQEQRDRTHHLAALEHALAHGDHALTVQAGSDYLHALGYPGPIDLSRETDMFWGGARFSYVMRDVALAAELEDQPALAAALYRRANPGGGGCGTSVSGRVTSQMEGLIRAEEARGQCQAVVAERLINRSTEAYGPERLADAGHDVARLYRGALLTRHRDGSLADIEAAIARAPADVREQARARLAARGPEAWEATVWAVEGLVHQTGRPGMEHVLTLVDQADPALRARMIAAIGQAGERGYMGTCADGFGRLTLRGSSRWSPTVEAFGDGCDTWLTDDEAEAVARRLLPRLRDDAPEVRAATARTLGYLAAGSTRGALSRAAKQAKRAETRCEAKDDDDCWRFGDVHREATEALETMEALVAEQGRDPWAEWIHEEGAADEADAELDVQASLGPLTAPPAMQRVQTGQP